MSQTQNQNQNQQQQDSKQKHPWLRRIKVTLGPLEEWRGSRKGEVITWMSDGTMNGLRITGTFNKTVMGQPSPTQISLYNLGQEIRNGITGSLTKITVECGYNNTDLQLLFQGSVLYAETHRSGPDLITKVSALPGYGAIVRGSSSKTFAPGTPVKTAVTTLAKDLPGVEVGDDQLKGIKGNIGAGGWSYAGSTKDGLTQLAEEYGFSWSIQDGKMTAIDDKLILPEFIELNGENGGLIDVTPQVEGPMAIMKGVKVKAIYVPGVTAGQSVKVNSKLNPKLNGTYRINTASISVDAYSESWTMDLDCKKGW